MKQPIVWIYQHLPKTGGTTFIGHLYKCFEWEKDYLHIGPYGDFYRADRGLPALSERSAEIRTNIKVLAGHKTYYGIHEWIPNRTPRYLTFIRCPAKRFESLFNFHISRKKFPLGTSFEDWYKTRTINEMTDWFNNRIDNNPPASHSFEKVKNFIDQCWFVGITSRLNEDLPLLFKTMGISANWKNYRVAGQPNTLKEINHHDQADTYKIYYKMDQATKDFIYQDNPEDVELFKYALKKNQETRQRMQLEID